MTSLQKESEWEKEFYEKFPLSFFADQGFVGFSEIDFTLWTQEATKRAESKRLHIKSFIREVIYQREQEISKEVEKLMEPNLGGDSFEVEARILRNFGRKEALSILKH